MARNKEMKKFIMVHHNWFVSSEFFSVEMIYAENEKEAQNKCDATSHRKSERHSRCAGVIVPISDSSEIEISRKLTIKERIFGRTFP